MENFINILGIVMLAFGILQIILFFKLWGMTNDVRWLKQHLGKEVDQQREIMKAIYRGDPNIEHLLFDYAYTRFHFAYERYFELYGGNADYKDREAPMFARALTEASVIYNKVGIAVPEVFCAIKSCKDFDAYFSLPKE